MENKEQYDFNTPIEKTATELAKMILAKIDEAKDSIIIENYEKADPATKAAFVEKSTDMSIEIMREIAKSDIPFPYATRSLEKISQIIQTLKQYIDGSINQARHEYASRSLGVKAPDNGKYTEEVATVGQLLLKLEEVRESQGNNKYDYFSDTPPATTVSADTPATPNADGLSTDAKVADTVTSA